MKYLIRYISTHNSCTNYVYLLQSILSTLKDIAIILIMSRQLQAIAKKKPKLLLRKILSKLLENNLINRFKGDYYKCKNSSYILGNNHYVTCKDGTKILIYNYSNYKAYLQKYSLCGKGKNIYLNNKAAY